MARPIWTQSNCPFRVNTWHLMFNMRRLSANNVANSATKISIFCRITKLALLSSWLQRKLRVLLKQSVVIFPDASSYSYWLSIVYILKGRLLKNLLVFLRKIEDLTFFFHRLPPNEGKKCKNSLFGPRQNLSVKIGHVGVYFAQKGCKIEDGFTDIFGFQLWRYCV